MAERMAHLRAVFVESNSGFGIASGTVAGNCEVGSFRFPAVTNQVT